MDMSDIIGNDDYELENKIRMILYEHDFLYGKRFDKFCDKYKGIYYDLLKCEDKKILNMTTLFYIRDIERMVRNKIDSNDFITWYTWINDNRFYYNKGTGKWSLTGFMTIIWLHKKLLKMKDYVHFM